jgi:predicted nucleic acid-binding protein
MRKASSASPPVVVLVTNLVLSALISASGQLALLRSAWQAGRFNPLASRATASELMRVLGYPKFKLSPAICW